MTTESEPRPEDAAPGEPDSPNADAPAFIPYTRTDFGDDLPPSDINEIDRERVQFLEMAQRAQANLENYKRRAEQEKSEIRRSANAALMRDLLAVLDDFDRAAAMTPDAIPQGEGAQGWLDGVRLVHRNFARILEAHGVAKIDALGKPFDPREHEAALHQETSDYEEGAVSQVFRDGYTLNGGLLRAAQVAVAKAPPAPEPTDAHEPTEPPDDDQNPIPGAQLN